MNPAGAIESGNNSENFLYMICYQEKTGYRLFACPSSRRTTDKATPGLGHKKSPRPIRPRASWPGLGCPTGFRPTFLVFCVHLHEIGTVAFGKTCILFDLPGVEVCSFLFLRRPLTVGLYLGPCFFASHRISFCRRLSPRLGGSKDNSLSPNIILPHEPRRCNRIWK